MQRSIFYIHILGESPLTIAYKTEKMTILKYHLNQFCDADFIQWVELSLFSNCTASMASFDTSPHPDTDNFLT